MSGTEMIVAIVAIACGTGISVTFLQTVRAAFERKPQRHSDAVVEEMRALRDEVRQLRSENSARVLNLDTTLESLDQRLSRLELRGQSSESEYQRMGR